MVRKSTIVATCDLCSIQKNYTGEEKELVKQLIIAQKRQGNLNELNPLAAKVALMVLQKTATGRTESRLKSMIESAPQREVAQTPKLSVDELVERLSATSST